MKTEEILMYCLNEMADHLESGSTVELFKAMYPYPLDDAGDIEWNISRVDSHAGGRLMEKVEGSLMDFERHFETRGEALAFRLRLENAVSMLTVLSKAAVPCELKTTIPEEAFLWALTTLWTAGGALWVHRTAQAFAGGLPSALPLPPPA